MYCLYFVREDVSPAEAMPSYPLELELLTFVSCCVGASATEPAISSCHAVCACVSVCVVGAHRPQPATVCLQKSKGAFRSGLFVLWVQGANSGCHTGIAESFCQRVAFLRQAHVDQLVFSSCVTEGDLEL